jgi:tetratricopeptide (TPR) repeat protein
MKKNKKNSITNLNDNNKYRLAFLIASIAFICITGFVVYSNIYGNTKHFDDIAFMEPYGLKNFEGVTDFLKINPFRIITYLSFSLNYQISGMQLPSYYFFNILVHVFNGILVFSLILMLFRSPMFKGDKLEKYGLQIALFGSLLFVVHPMQTQAVTYIYQRLASLAALFYLATICLYVKARLSKMEGSPRPYLYLLAVIAGLIALFTKENTFTLPLMIALFELTVFHPKLKITWNASGIGLLSIFAGIVLVFSIFGPDRVLITMFSDNGTEINSRNYLLTQFSVIPNYIRMLILPINQNLDYDFPLSTSFFDLWTIAGFLFNAGLIGFAIFMFNRKKIVSFAIFWFYITIIIESSIIPILDVINEHRLYLPMFGFVLLLSVLMFEYGMKRSVPGTVAIISLIILICGYMTYERNKIWKDEITLWTDVINKSPNKMRPYNNRGLAFLAVQRYRDAIDDFTASIKIYDNNANAYNNRGYAYYATGDTQNAISDYTYALKINPNNLDALINRGNSYKKLNDYPNALVDYSRAIAAQPATPDVYYLRAEVYASENLIDSAANDYQKIIAISPNDVKVYIDLGDLMLNSGNRTKAIEAYSHAVNIEPANSSIHNNLASAYYFENDYDKAADEYWKAIQYKPDFVEAYINLASIYEKRNDFSKAADTYSSAIGYHSGNPNLFFMRAEAYSKLKKFISAESDLVEALKIAPNFRKAQIMLDSVRLLIKS